MKTRILSVAALSTLLSAVVWAGGEQCKCPSKTAKTVAWCQPCKGGVAFSHKTTSPKLVTALEGHEVDVTKMKCDGCKKAAENNTTCCGKRFVNMTAYKSPVSAALAKGTVVDESKVECQGCKSSIKAGKGYCPQCKIGVVHGLAFQNQEDFEAAILAYAVLASALEASSHCETCAVAIVTDGSCTQCNVTFKEGKPLKG